MMETIDEIAEIMGIDLKQKCKICNKNIKSHKYTTEYPHYLTYLNTTCMYNYPNKIYIIESICINKHHILKRYIPNEETDYRYKIKYSDFLRRHREYMAKSYNLNWDDF